MNVYAAAHMCTAAILQFIIDSFTMHFNAHKKDLRNREMNIILYQGIK